MESFMPFGMDMNEELNKNEIDKSKNTTIFEILRKNLSYFNPH